MTVITPKPIYISSGCNRCPKSLDWGGNRNQIIYAHANSVALLSEQEPFQIKCTFNKHTDKINAVKWISKSDQINMSSIKTSEFVSASKDKSVIVWQGDEEIYEPFQQLDGHTNNVCVVDGMYFNNEDNNLLTLITSASVDSTVRIWTRISDLNLNEIGENRKSNFKLDQIITAKANGFALALKFFSLPLSKLPLLLIGFDNHKIEIHVRLHADACNNDQFYCLHTLIGHEDWIRDVDICQTNENQLLIASSSQDNYIRLWKLDSTITTTKPSDTKNNVELITEKITNEKKVEEDDEDEDLEEACKKVQKSEEELKLKSSLFTLYSKLINAHVQYSINLESVLYGHEDWIYTVKFHPKMSYGQPLVLISASMDKTLVIWKYDEENAIWIDQSRVGDIGGNTLGFYGATFEPNGRYIIAHGYQGALHLWKRNIDEQNRLESLSSAVINGGHFDLVEDICWEPENQFLISVSKDQTSRFHGFWKHQQNDNEISTWHELGRPQIHGYDLKCVSFLDRFKFVSGADEKLLRIFESPKIFLENLYNLCGDENILKLIKEGINLPQGASVPALGLSNKAVFDDEKLVSSDEKKVTLAEELYKEVYFNRIELNKPPTEEHLLQNTLWPEIQKLYGHGYELFAVAVEPRTRLIASSCKATKADHAAIILWQEELTNGQKLYKQFATLKGHDLTVVQMKFSNNGNYLLSVSRDRSYKLFIRKEEKSNMFELIRSISTKNSYHTRIIWSCDWSHDDKYYVTTSRDKRVCIWNGVIENDIINLDAKPIKANPDKSHLFLELDDSITASAFAPDLTTDNNYLLAFGYENGRIDFFKWNLEHGFQKYSTVENRFSHHLTVKKLSFRKVYQTKNGQKTFCLASCSDDCSVRLFEINA